MEPPPEPDVERATRVQDALYRIAEAASAAQDLSAFYATIHEIIGELMYARNFYVALYDDDRGLINFPYYVDTVDPAPPDPKEWAPFGIGGGGGMTAYVLRKGQARFQDEPGWRALIE